MKNYFHVRTFFLSLLILLGSFRVEAAVIAQFFGVFDTIWENQRLRVDTPLQIANRFYISFGKVVLTPMGYSLAIDGDPVLNTAARVRELIARIRAVNPTAEIFLTLGDSSNLLYPSAARDPGFPSRALQFMATFDKGGVVGLNGLDIDWETNLDQGALSRLVTGLATALHASGKLLTLDVWPYFTPFYEISILRAQLDQINIMSYGVNMDLKTSVESYRLAGFPVEKMIGGIETESTYPGGVDTLGPAGTIFQKANYALINGLAGMMAWREDNDDVDPYNINYPRYFGAQTLWVAMHQFSWSPEEEEAGCGLLNSLGFGLNCALTQFLNELNLL